MARQQLECACRKYSWFFLSISQLRMHQYQKSLCPSSRGGPEKSKTPPTCEVLILGSQNIFQTIDSS